MASTDTADATFKAGQPTTALFEELLLKRDSNHDYTCSCCVKGGKPPNAARDLPTSTDVTVTCTPTGTLPEIMCTAQPEDAAVAQGIQPRAELHAKRSLAPTGTSPSDLSGLFGIIALITLGSTLWYRRKYHQALNAHQYTTA